MKLSSLGLMGSAKEVEINNNAIVVEGLCKSFRIPMEKKLTVYENLIGLLRGGTYSYEEFLALQGVSFSIKHGETFGVIGPNGCGKSTLLKVLAGVLYPDCGTVKINGKIAPFLELGVGFQPELSARDNVYLYGAIMGLTHKDVEKRYDEIMDFSELKRFENMKLRNFSSGMYVRLAFATAIQTNPDVMLVDEVLSVGDAAFQEKCHAKIRGLLDRGCATVLVSHNMNVIKKNCHRVVWLEKGRVKEEGDAEEIVGRYLEYKP